MAKVVKKVPKKKGKDNSDKGIKVEVVKKNNLEKTEEVVKDTIGNSDREDEDEVSEKQIKHNMALVGMTKGYSYNMGNYESAKITCSIRVPCKNTDEDIMDEMNRISELLEEQLEFEANELLGDEEE